MANPPLNPISFRLPFNLDENNLDSSELVKAVRYLASGSVDLNQAVASLKGQVDTAQTTATTAQATASVNTNTGVRSFNTLAGNVTFYPQLGAVNNQLGQPAYTTQQTDNGAKIIVGDSSAVAVTLNAGVGTPWFTVIDNDSSAVANLAPSAGSLFGAQSIPSGGFAIVYYDGNFWCGATPNVIIGIDSTVATAKLTGGGANGSMTFHSGVLISSVQAT